MPFRLHLVSHLTVKLLGEGQGVEVTSIFLFHIILKIANILTIPEPGSPLELVPFERVHENPEALVVEGLGFHQIEDVEFVLHVLSGVGNREEVPLGVSSGVVIGVDDQVVLIRSSRQKIEYERNLWIFELIWS